MSLSGNLLFPIPECLSRSDCNNSPRRSREALHRIRRAARPLHLESLRTLSRFHGGTNLQEALLRGNAGYAIAGLCWREATGRLWRRKWAALTEQTEESKGKSRPTGKRIRCIVAWNCRIHSDLSSEMVERNRTYTKNSEQNIRRSGTLFYGSFDVPFMEKLKGLDWIIVLRIEVKENIYCKHCIRL